MSLRTLLVLGRISNLPTVWSNCLAAWLMAGGGKWDRFAILCAGASLLYTAGMFLNDAFDAGFDRQFRAERPIPSGQITLRTVWVLAVALMIAGWVALLVLGLGTALFAAVLVAAIVAYDAIHKHTAFAPLLMAACRFLLHVVAASAAQSGPAPLLFWRAGALAAYITGISFLARGESAPIPIRAWPVALLFMPAILALFLPPVFSVQLWCVAAFAFAWVLWCLRGPWVKPPRPLASAVPGLLAGIVLVDWLGSGVGFSSLFGIFVALLLLALALQRIAPAT